ncbi:MAG: methyltransferase [Candidatus Thiodiazotropha endolucinida]|nr:methyltransferase [Candidatus Thiodiazotropha taylori]MCW4316715.1 methyltransferase [Candidatus Thiodiazotropha taylori]
MKQNDKYLTELDKDGIHVTTRPYLNKVIAHVEPYEVDVFGRSITVFPGVMSPKYDWAGLFMIDELPDSFSGQHVLEIGTGCGLVSVYVGLRGAESITATDINPIAIENTQFNFDKFSIPNAEVVLSDAFGNVTKKQYDSIIFNLPYHDGSPSNDLEKGVIDAGYGAMTKFFSGAADYLRPDGMLYVGFSRSGNRQRFFSEVERNHFVIHDMVEKNTWDDPRYLGPDFNYNCQVYKMSPKS